MKIINNIATLCMSFGLSIFAGSLLFAGGPLSVVGWLVCLPLFVGSTGHVALSIYKMIPESKTDDKKVDAKNEEQGVKPGTQTAGATS